MLESIVLLDRRRIGQVKHVACFNQAIDESVPVVGRLHNDAGEFLSIGGESRAYRTQIVGQPPGIYDLVGVVGDDDKAIVGVEVYAAK